MDGSAVATSSARASSSSAARARSRSRGARARSLGAKRIAMTSSGRSTTTTTTTCRARCSRDARIEDASVRTDARAWTTATALAVVLTLGGAGDARAAPEGVFDVAANARAGLERLEEIPVVGALVKDEEIAVEAVRDGRTAGEKLDLFLEKEPPIAVALVAMLLVNGSFGLVYTLFVRETSVGPGGEFGKAVVAVRQSVVKGIFAFFNSALGRYTTKDSRDA